MRRKIDIYSTITHVGIVASRKIARLKNSFQSDALIVVGPTPLFTQTPYGQMHPQRTDSIKHETNDDALGSVDRSGS